MPILLAVETATQTASVALWRGDSVCCARSAESGRPAAEALMPAVEALLAEAALELSEVEGFAVSIGPGSFTGLRIGVATVKGLAFGTGRRVVAVSTLEALAGQASGAAPVAAILDARRGELYAAGFEGGLPAPWLPEAVVPERELARRLPTGCRVVGEGLAVCAERLRETRGQELELLPVSVEVPASQVARLAAPAWQRGEAIEAEALTPRYVRRAEAEVKRTGQRFEST